MKRRVVIPDLRAGYCSWMTGRIPDDGADRPHLGLALPKPLLGYDGVRGRRRVFVTEGSFDWLTLISWGLPACTSLGTQPGASGLRLLARARSIVLVFDNHDGGREAAEALQRELGDRVRVLTLPDGIKDVNELAQQEDGRETFFSLLAALDEGRKPDVAQAR